MSRKRKRGDIGIRKGILTNYKRFTKGVADKRNSCIFGGGGDFESAECLVTDDLESIGENKSCKTGYSAEYTVTDDLYATGNGISARLSSREEYKLGNFLVIKDAVDGFEIGVGA